MMALYHSPYITGVVNTIQQITRENSHSSCGCLSKKNLQVNFQVIFSNRIHNSKKLILLESRLYIIFWDINMDVSENRGTPKSSILIGFSIIDHPFWGTPIFGNTQNILYTQHASTPASTPSALLFFRNRLDWTLQTPPPGPNGRSLKGT